MTEVFPLIYHQGKRDTYLSFISENFQLITSLTEDYEKLDAAENLYKKKAKSLQIKSLLGINSEHLIKIVLLKRGFVLNTIINENAKFNSSFMQEIEDYNKSMPNREKLDSLLQKSLSQIKEFSEKLIKFGKCIKNFKNSNPKDYFKNIKRGNLNPSSEDYKYLGEFEFIDSSNALNIIQKMRNSYVHKAEGNYEKNIIVPYLLNFLLFIAKKEFPDWFNNIEKFGNEETKNLFP
ncbi:hypothetical protein HYY71_01800 [Candidatus Woesearchaeota archaeon]|nr:hypothetical protein [Candidatus Woesearchaeota archaeon]